MRTYFVLGAVMAALVLAMPARAQSLSFGGIDPTKIVNKPISVPDNVMPIARPQTVQSAGFSLTKYLPKVTLPTGKKVFGTSTFPTPDQMPGKNYLNAFKYQYGKPVE